MARISWDASGVCLALISATRVKILDSRDGSCKFSHSITEPVSAAAGREQEMSPLGPGLLGNFSRSGRYFALCEPQKTLFIWKTDTWECINQRKAARRATALLFTNKEDFIVVADKSGDVYRFSMSEPEKEGELLLGHVSMILDMAISSDDKYLITADRDEKIRISYYPNAYNIQSYCLGHNDFVSSLSMFSSDCLVSGGGDGCLRCWHIEQGHEIVCKKLKDNFEEKQPDSLESAEPPVVSCLACCRKNNVICALVERSRTLHLYHLCEKEVNCLPPVQTDVPPWYVSFDPEGRLWCIQANPQEPVVVFNAQGLTLEFSKVQQDSIPSLVAANDWSFLSDCVGREPNLAVLRKKDIDNMSDYLARKEERVQAKKAKDHTTKALHDVKETDELHAKRPKLEPCSANGK